MSGYKKPMRADKVALATVKIILTALVVGIAAIVLFYGIKDGWQSVIEWFVSKWACLIAVVLIVAGTASLWILSIFKKAKDLGDEEE